MKLLNFLTGGLVKSIENVALEVIETDKESAEAKALFIKTLDPNGLMRRQISLTVSLLYSLYLITMLMLVILQGIHPNENLMITIKSVADLFIPITTLFGVIVSASFGVNYQNIKQGN